MIGAWAERDRDACRPPLQAAGGGGAVALRRRTKREEDYREDRQGEDEEVAF